MKQLILFFFFIVQSINGYAQYTGSGAGIEPIDPNEWGDENFSYCYLIESKNSYVLYDTDITISANQHEIKMTLKKKNYHFKIKEIIDCDDFALIHTSNKEIWLKAYNYTDENGKYNDDVIFFINGVTYIITNTKK